MEKIKGRKTITGQNLTAETRREIIEDWKRTNCTATTSKKYGITQVYARQLVKSHRIQKEKVEKNCTGFFDYDGQCPISGMRM